MSHLDALYIRQELEKRFPDLDDDLDEGGASRTYRKCQEVYNATKGDPIVWKLVEVMDADTLEVKWQWVRKS